MKKSMNIIIWIVALAALMTAAYTYYEKNKGQASNPPVLQNPAARENTAGAGQPSQPAGTAVPGGTGSMDTSAAYNSGNEAATTARKVPAPDFKLKDLDGNEVRLSDYKGKIVFLNFWAVWCKYCKLEMPDLNKFGKELEKRNDAVLLAIDVQEKPDTVREYLKANDITLKVLMDEDGSVAGTYGVEGYPTTFVINSDGSLYTYIPGATDIETLRTILDKIRNGEPLNK